MTRTVLIALFIVTTTLTTHARLGETPDQCEQRYGKHVLEIAGHGVVPFCRIYEKQDLKIAAVFIKGRASPKVGCILYSTHREVGVWLTRRKLTKEEQDSLLATVPGQWKFPSASPAPTLQGGGPRRELSVKPNSIGDSRMRASLDAAENMMQALYPCSISRGLKEVGRNGPDKYAFTFNGGIAITYCKVSDAIIAWSKAVEAQRAEARKPDPKELKGF